jgi:cytochrome c nitrite reductase small subunit
MPAAANVAAHGSPVQAGGALEWSIAISIGLGLLILVLIGVSVFVYRGRQTEGGALWLHLLSLGVFPLFLLAVGNFAVFEYAKEEQFCGSCHRTMKVYIDDLHNRKSESLASLHFQNRFAHSESCYSCHADYGVHGTFQAKATGLRHLYRYMTRTYTIPITMPHPFPNSLCLKCHEGAKRFMAEKVHLDNDRVNPALLSGKKDCMSCHGPAHELPKARAAAGGEKS